ncbi:hypothetical protein B5S29_g4217 [[Candida] boidinii]|nr:hypothetical protein B5S29_g4217 [[Candida] boidinii]
MFKNSFKFIQLSNKLNNSLNFKRFISLKTLSTPNENALKFVAKDFKFLPKDITDLNHGDAIEIDDLPDATYKSPLAISLFKINGVRSLLIGSDFITINKVDDSLSNNNELRWPHLAPKIIDCITNFIENKQDLLIEENEKLNELNDTNNNNKSSELKFDNINLILTKEYLLDLQKKLDEPQDNDDDITYEIKELINTRIRPALQDDGGDIHFRKFDANSGIVYIKLKGACKSCSLSEDTLKNGIESMLKHYIDEVEEVKAVLDPEEEIALQEFEKLEERLKLQRK